MVALRIPVQSLARKQTDVTTGSGFLFTDAYLITPERGWVSASPTLPDVKSFQAHTISTNSGFLLGGTRSGENRVPATPLASSWGKSLPQARVRPDEPADCEMEFCFLC